MPGFNFTGPLGKGPRSGRKMGRCGGGQGFGNQGFGRGFRGAAPMEAQPGDESPVYEKLIAERERYEERIAVLENELAELKQKMKF